MPAGSLAKNVGDVDDNDEIDEADEEEDEEDEEEEEDDDGMMEAGASRSGEKPADLSLLFSFMAPFAG